MNYYDELARQVSIEPSETSYFSEAQASLDPTLFEGDRIRGDVRNAILSMALRTLELKYQNPSSWLTVWLAGSGVSFNWSAQRDPADLDCLVGVDYLVFRQNNPGYKGLSDQEIAKQITEDFRENLHTGDFMGKYDLTFYANVKSDIRDIKPYAAYSLTDDLWTVPPSPLGVQRNPQWDAVVDADQQKAQEIAARYDRSLHDLHAAVGPAQRRNAEMMLSHSISQGSALFDMIHESRKEAFGPQGEGYGDFANYRWQAGKARGHVQAMRKLKDLSENVGRAAAGATYGIELPDASILVRRAATHYTR